MDVRFPSSGSGFPMALEEDANAMLFPGNAEAFPQMEGVVGEFSGLVRTAQGQGHACGVAVIIGPPGRVVHGLPELVRPVQGLLGGFQAAGLNVQIRQVGPQMGQIDPVLGGFQMCLCLRSEVLRTRVRFPGQMYQVKAMKQTSSFLTLRRGAGLQALLSPMKGFVHFSLTPGYQEQEPGRSRFQQSVMVFDGQIPGWEGQAVRLGPATPPPEQPGLAYQKAGAVLSISRVLCSGSQPALGLLPMTAGHPGRGQVIAPRGAVLLNLRAMRGHPFQGLGPGGAQAGGQEAQVDFFDDLGQECGRGTLARGQQQGLADVGLLRPKGPVVRGQPFRQIIEPLTKNALARRLCPGRCLGWRRHRPPG